MFVKGCMSCQRNKANTKRYAGLLQQHDVPAQKWQQVAMDFVTGLPLTRLGHNMIMVVIDTLTKMVHFIPGKMTDGAEEVAQHYFMNVYKLHGWPRAFITDRDGRFLDAFFRAICSQLGTRQIMSTAHHHEHAGQVERMNRVLEETLRHYVSDTMDDWDVKLPAAEFSVNNSYQRSIGTTPFYLNYGYHPAFPMEVGVSPHPDADAFLHGQQSVMQTVGRYHAFAQQRLHADAIALLVKDARTQLFAARNKQKQYADQRRSDLCFRKGDQVMLKTKNLNLLNWPSRKLFPLWLGPFEVDAVISKVSYRLVLPAHWRIHPVFHVNLLKPFWDNGQNCPPSPFTYIAGQPYEYEVDHIVSHWPENVPIYRGLPVKVLKPMKFLVRWKNASADFDTWEPFSNLKHAPESLTDYGL